MYTFLSGLVKSKIGTLNNNFPDTKNKLTEIETSLAQDFLPTSLEDKTYLIKLSSVELDEETLSGNDFNLSATVSLFFEIEGAVLSDYSNWIVNYIFPLFDLLICENYENHTEGYFINGINSMSIAGLDATDKSGAYLTPVLMLNYKVKKLLNS